ncbi:MAG: hypothetical protein ABH871_09995 [Pseudomonadota bacterium]
MTIKPPNLGLLTGMGGLPLSGTDFGITAAGAMQPGSVAANTGAVQAAEQPEKLLWSPEHGHQQGLTPFKPVQKDLSREEVSKIIEDTATKRGIYLSKSLIDNIVKIICLRTARPALTSDQIAKIFANIESYDDLEGKSSFETAAALIKENSPASMIMPYINSTYPRGLSYPELPALLNTSPLTAIKFLHEDRIPTFANFSGRWLSLKSVVFLLEKISMGEVQQVRKALKIFLHHEITPTYDTLRELVEFADSYPSIDNALRSDPKRKNNCFKVNPQLCWGTHRV